MPDRVFDSSVVNVFHNVSKTENNLVEAHCYGKDMTGQFLSGHVAVKQIEGYLQSILLLRVHSRIAQSQQDRSSHIHVLLYPLQSGKNMQWPRGASISAAPKLVNQSGMSLAQPRQNGGRVTRHYSAIVLSGWLARCFLGQVGLHSLFVGLCLTQCQWTLPRPPHRSFDSLNHRLLTYHGNTNEAATQSSMLTRLKQSSWVVTSLFRSNNYIQAPPKFISNAKGAYNWNGKKNKISPWRRFNWSGACIRN